MDPLSSQTKCNTSLGCCHGAVAGRRVVADWPGLGASALREGRDLRPTLGLDTLIASAVSQHDRLDMPRTARALFPNIAGAPAIDGLIRA